MGSGTTLLRLILDSHPSIAVPQETGFMRAERAHRFIPFKWSGRRWYLRLGWTHKEFRALEREFYDTVFRRYAERHGKVRWGEKTPLHTWHIDRMAKLFPDSVFVGVVRHPGGSVASNMTRWRHGLRKASWHYQRYTTELTRQAARRKRRFRVIRYEDLVLRPEQVLRELLDWLGEEWSDAVLEHHSIQGARGGKLSVEGKVRVDDAIDTSRVTKWTDAIDSSGRAVLARRVGRLGEFWGYSMDDPLALEALGSHGRLLINGRDIEPRIEQFKDVDFTAQPPMPAADLFYHPRDIKVSRVNAAKEERPEDRPWPRTRFRRAALPVVRRLPAPARRGLATIARRSWNGGLSSRARAGRG